MTTVRTLTVAQAIRLDKLPHDTQVVGWLTQPTGPIVRKPDGQLRLIRPDGRLAGRNRSLAPHTRSEP